MAKKNREIVVVRAPEGAHVVVLRGDAKGDVENNIHVMLPEWQVKSLLAVLEAQILQALTKHFGGRPVFYDWMTPEKAWASVPYGTDAKILVHVDGKDIPVVVRRASPLTIFVQEIVSTAWSARP